VSCVPSVATVSGSMLCFLLCLSCVLCTQCCHCLWFYVVFFALFVLCLVYPVLNHHKINEPIGGVMVSVLVLSAVDRGFEPRSGQTKDNKIGICCFSAKHAVLMRKSRDLLVLNQNNVSEWSDMSTR
jgi:hypothetical protein